MKQEELTKILLISEMSINLNLLCIKLRTGILKYFLST